MDILLTEPKINAGLPDLSRVRAGHPPSPPKPLRKGARTRAKLMEATAELLKTTYLRDLRASDVSKRAKVAVGTFYLYFDNVEAAALALSWEIGEEAQSLAEPLRQVWDKEGCCGIETFIRSYFAFWEKYGSIILVRNLAAAAGDAAFLEARLHMEVPLYKLLDIKISEAKARGCIAQTESDAALSGLLLGSLEQQASFSNFVDFSQYGVSRDELIGSSIFLFRKTLFAPYEA